MNNIFGRKFKLINLLIAVILICGMIPAQATENNSSCIVAFDPDDGITQYKDFYRATVEIGAAVTDMPAAPKRDGYFFQGWYSYLDENDNPVLWDFEKDKVNENTTLWAAWEKGCIVAFDPDDGITQYKDFYKTTVEIGAAVTDMPAAPKRDGYFFQGWYSYLDENDNPVLWDFEKDEVNENTTLWAAWEKGCIVAFDPDDGITQYKDFYKTTVEIGAVVTDIPAVPKRDGYFFQGWYSYLDENDNPVLWDFEKDKVHENTTLWAAWEKGCIVAFDPDDGITQYQDFYKTTVEIGAVVTDIPAAPKRDGYFFQGWYSYLDENDNPVLWDFEQNEVSENTTLWAAWRKSSGGGGGTGNGGGDITVRPELEKDDHYRYILGYDDKTIRPENNITREETAAVLFRLMTKDSRMKYREQQSLFTDVSEGRWSAMSIGTLAHAGIVKGYDGGSFQPEGYITRAEFSSMVMRFADLTPNAGHNFTDISGHWAEQAIASAVEYGWIKGYPDQSFRPENLITRVEAMTLINRVLERQVDEHGILSELVEQWTDLSTDHWGYYDILEACVSHNYEHENPALEQWTGKGPELDFEKE